MKDGRGFWVGDYWGVISFGVNGAVVSQRAEDVERPAQARVQEQGRVERQPALVGIRCRGGVRGSARERRLAEQHQAGHRLLPAAEGGGQLHPGAGDPQTIASGQTPIMIDWDYLNLAYSKEFPSREDQDVDPVRRGLRRALLPGDQRNGAAPVGGAPVAGVPLLRPGAAALAEGVLAPGALHRHGRAQGRAEGALEALPNAAAYAKVKFASPAQLTEARALIATEWPKKVGS